MKSKTKFLTDDETIRKLYLNAGYKQVTGIKLCLETASSTPYMRRLRTGDRPR